MTNRFSQQMSIINGTLQDPVSSRQRIVDVHIQDNLICALGSKPAGFKPDIEFDATGMMVCPGLTDICSRLITTDLITQKMIIDELGSFLQGGITQTMCLPHGGHHFNASGHIEWFKQICSWAGGVRVSPLASASLRPDDYLPLDPLKKSGIRGIVIDHHMNLHQKRKQLLWAKSQAVPVWIPGFYYAKKSDQSLSALHQVACIQEMLFLLEDTGTKSHFYGVSCHQTVDLIHRYKQMGLPITLDIPIVYLVLHAQSKFDIFRMIPALGSRENQEALCEDVIDGKVDAICVMHNPIAQTLLSEYMLDAYPGVAVASSFLPALSFLQKKLGIDWLSLMTLVTTGPAKIIGNPFLGWKVGSKADMVIYQPEHTKRFKNKQTYLHQNNPFGRLDFTSQVIMTIIDGEMVYKLEY